VRQNCQKHCQNTWICIVVTQLRQRHLQYDEDSNI
jgi:hypothetical protein